MYQFLNFDKFSKLIKMSLGSGKFTLGVLRKMALKKLAKNLKMAFGKIVVPLFGKNGQIWGSWK